MTIAIGDKIPAATLLELTSEGPKEVDFTALLEGKTVAFFGLPGAYTGVCTTAHVPSFIRAADALKAKGVDEIVCVSVNDPFVMGAWAKDTGAEDAGIRMLGDASGAFIKALGLDFSAPPVGLIGRSKRFSAVAKDGVLTVLQLEESPGECTISAGESLVDAL